MQKISDSYGSRQAQDEILSRDYRQYNTSNMSISQASARAQADFTQGTHDINNYVSPFLISSLKIKKHALITSFAFAGPKSYSNSNRLPKPLANLPLQSETNTTTHHNKVLIEDNPVVKDLSRHRSNLDLTGSPLKGNTFKNEILNIKAPLMKQVWYLEVE